MDTINYLILGLLQGIFEWIPISSEGVVALAAKYLGMAQNPVDLALFCTVARFWRRSGITAEIGKMCYG